MEHRDIEIFLTLVDELHFGRAARRLHVSTARVSQTIKKLERRIGTPLFDRTSRRVEPTAVGRRLCDELRPAYQEIQDAVARATAAGRGARATLRVGFIGAASGRFVLDVADTFRGEHPGCEITLRENQFGEGLGPLRSGEIDVLLATVPDRVARQADLTAGSVLVEEGQMVAVPAGHPFAGRPSVSFAELAATTVLRTPSAISGYWDDELVPSHTPDGHPTRRGPCFETTQEMLALVGAGAGTYPVSTQFTSYYVHPGVAYVPIHDAPPYQRRLLWLPAAETDHVRAFERAAARTRTP